MSRFLLLVATALAAAACQAPITAQHDRDARAAFESYATYAWITERPMIEPQLGALGQSALMSPFLDRDVREAVERNLAAKGYRQVRDLRQADLVVAFGVAERDRIQSQPASGRLGFRLNATELRSYTEGALVITFFDPTTRRPIWYGWATGKLPSQRASSRRNELVSRAADAILASFPQRTAS
jgi:hypothetical protein